MNLFFLLCKPKFLKKTLVSHYLFYICTTQLAKSFSYENYPYNYYVVVDY